MVLTYDPKTRRLKPAPKPKATAPTNSVFVPISGSMLDKLIAFANEDKVITGATDTAKKRAASQAVKGYVLGAIQELITAREAK
jgi:hypothetical protein